MKRDFKYLKVILLNYIHTIFPCKYTKIALSIMDKSNSPFSAADRRLLKLVS